MYTRGLSELRILIHTNASQYDHAGIGGAETSLRLLGDLLSKKGHHVYYVTRNRQKLSPSLRVEQVNGVDVYLFSPIKWPSKFLKKLDPIKTKWISKQFCLLIERIIKRNKVQIVHTFNEYPATYDILQLRMRYPHFKIVLRVAGLFWYNRCKEFPDLINKIEWVFNNVDLLTFISKGMEKQFVEHTELLGMKINNQNHQVLEIGTDFKFHRNKWKKRQKDKIRLVMVGRLAFPKRQDLLIEAIRHLNNKKIELHFFGNGSEKGKLINLTIKYKLKDHVFFHGMVPQKRIAEFLEQADLFCHASEYEGLCKSVLEAMCVGTPVLVSDVMSLNSYIINGFNGYLVKNNFELWASKIHDLLFENNDFKEISKNEINFVKQNYNPENNINDYIDAFQSIIQEK